MKEKMAIVSLVIGIFACIGTYLALPQIQKLFSEIYPANSPELLAEQSSDITQSAPTVTTHLEEKPVQATIPTGTPTKLPAFAPTITATPLSPTPTHTLQFPTETPRPTATHTKTPLPPSPMPTPDGIGSWVGDESFQVKLLDHDFRSISNDNDEGAVRVYLSFINNTNNEVELAINWYIVTGTDNIGTKYGERNSVGDRYFSWSNAQEQLENWSMSVPPNSIETMWFDLHVEGNNAGHVTRVDIRTDWIDLKIPSIVYRTDKLHQVSANWRLIR